ncbi:INO80 complex subunit B isoform X1 [Octopus sinensis]|uniref:INO80 complex subunit B isoform X1 n=1 Tax=Octopus sinensis TaxID=2607531 RepID=A0A6P7TNN0_9MOLL|nr:INO80 complex subunit B isoform X1 [Octopus sinensis]
MGKKKEQTTEEDVTDSPISHKKHKKHKKKHKRRKEDLLSEPHLPAAAVSDSKPSIKLRIRLGGETLSSKKFVLKDDSNTSSLNEYSPTAVAKMKSGGNAKLASLEDEPVDVDDTQLPDPLASAIHPSYLTSNSIISGIMAPSINPWGSSIDFDMTPEKVEDTPEDGEEKKEETSDEEQAWLDALEAGELDDFGEIRKPKDPNLLTARQRALLHGKQEQELLELPSGYKTVELTEEQIQRRQQRAKKRRLQAQEKREKDKKQTLERLLKKQETKTKAPKFKTNKRTDIARYSYVNGVSGIFISVPAGFDFPLRSKTRTDRPKTVLCGVRHCNKVRKYSCSKTGVPLCSLQCYKKNLQLHKVAS